MCSWNELSKRTTEEETGLFGRKPWGVLSVEGDRKGLCWRIAEKERICSNAELRCGGVATAELRCGGVASTEQRCWGVATQRASLRIQDPGVWLGWESCKQVLEMSQVYTLFPLRRQTT